MTDPTFPTNCLQPVPPVGGGELQAPPSMLPPQKVRWATLKAWLLAVWERAKARRRAQAEQRRADRIAWANSRWIDAEIRRFEYPFFGPGIH